jgi:hypothetical protein
MRTKKIPPKRYFPGIIAVYKQTLPMVGKIE